MQLSATWLTSIQRLQSDPSPIWSEMLLEWKSGWDWCMRKVEWCSAAAAAAPMLPRRPTRPSSSWTRRQVLPPPTTVHCVHCVYTVVNCELFTLLSGVNSEQCQLDLAPSSLWAKTAEHTVIHYCQQCTQSCAHTSMKTVQCTLCPLFTVHSEQCVNSVESEQCQEPASWTRRQVLGQPTAKSAVHWTLPNVQSYFYTVTTAVLKGGQVSYLNQQNCAKTQQAHEVQCLIVW